MHITGWTWAELNDEQINKIYVAEQSLGGKDYLVAYQPSSASDELLLPPLKAATLSPSQLHDLTSLEQQIQATIVAYTH